MKYKVGDEVLVKAKIISGTRMYFGVDIEGNRFDVCEENIVPVPSMTAEESWEIAKKILLYPEHGGYNSSELEEIFGRTEHLWEMTPQQAKSKIEAWEAEKEIKVGDVIFVTYNQSINGVVTNIYGKDEKKLYVLRDDGSSGVLAYTKSIKKTGRHIDIEGLLKQIGGTVEERNNNN